MNMITKPLTTGEIAQYCHVNYRTVLSWIEAGKLKAYRTPGKHSRITMQDFLKFLTKYKMPIPAELKNILDKTRAKKILIIDDDKLVVNSIKRFLNQQANFEIQEAYDGFDAGRKVIDFLPDLVILDIKMPGMNGYDVAARIKKIPELSDTKIIAISGFFEQEGKEKIKSLGADVCLDKPFDPDELLKIINKIFNS